MERQGYIKEDVVRFWLAELSSAIEYLHGQRIIHRYVLLRVHVGFRELTELHSSFHLSNRDLKPDNILLDKAGHAHITDFNVAIHYSERRLHSSVAGSMAYMAPQVVSRKGYSWQIDWWSLGITAYELLFRNRPFDGRTAEKMTQAILKDPLKFPDNASERVSDEGIAVLKGVCNKSDLCCLTMLTIVFTSSLNATQINDWGADQTARESRIYTITPGSVV